MKKKTKNKKKLGNGVKYDCILEICWGGRDTNKKNQLGLNPAFYPYNGHRPSRMRDIIRDLFTAWFKKIGVLSI